jgi:hypothetical protein
MNEESFIKENLFMNGEYKWETPNSLRYYFFHFSATILPFQLLFIISICIAFLFVNGSFDFYMNQNGKCCIMVDTE